DKKEIPASLYLEKEVAGDELIDNSSEIEGTLWFISLLTKVDGLVLMNPYLEVRGFGTEITFSDEPSEIFVANTRNATRKSLKKADYNHYGTRHRSMMRYCSQIENSVGFVISQDGDVRVITQVDGNLVIWENIKLQQHFDDIKRKK
ncbi:MAG TPA: hypothetical protein VGB02_00960, partial [Pyrinomonadaceae bacterium]